MMGLPYGKEIMIVGRTMWTQSTSVTDRQTDRQTDGQTDRITIIDTVQRIASHGKNCDRAIFTARSVVEHGTVMVSVVEFEIFGHSPGGEGKEIKALRQPSSLAKPVL